MSIENQRDATTAVDQTLISLARKWRDITANAKGDCSLPGDADMLALSCLLLAADWGDNLTESVNPVLEENAALAEKRWSIQSISDIETLVWRLCHRDTETESVQGVAVENLVEYLTHHNSAFRIWAIKLSWMARPYLPADTVVPLMLKNIADTLGGVRLAMGLASGLCATDNDLETFIAKYEPEEFVEQYADRIKMFRKEGFSLSRAELLDLEYGCRQIVEREILGYQLMFDVDGKESIRSIGVKLLELPAPGAVSDHKKSGMLEATAPNVLRACSHVVWALAKYAKYEGKRSFWGHDKGEWAFQKIVEALRLVVLGLYGDGVLSQGANTEECLIAVLRSLVEFKGAFPNWHDAYCAGYKVLVEEKERIIPILASLQQAVEEELFRLYEVGVDTHKYSSKTRDVPERDAQAGDIPDWIPQGIKVKTIRGDVEIMPRKPTEVETQDRQLGKDEHAGAISLRQLMRDRGVRPGTTIHFPEDAEKTEFWDSYPRDEAEFRRHVIPESYSDEGICYDMPQKYSALRSPKDFYRGISRQEVGRLCFFWISDKKNFEARHSPEVMEAIKEFLEERSLLEAEAKAKFDAEKERQRPPTPPIGYYWRPVAKEWGLGFRYALEIEQPTIYLVDSYP